MENSRLLAVYDGGGGGGVGGDAGGGSSGNNWTLLLGYLSTLEEYPVITKAVTSALLTFLGDLICQANKYETVVKLVAGEIVERLAKNCLPCKTLFRDVAGKNQVSSLDMKRNFLFIFLGLVLVGLTLHFWYMYLRQLVTVSGALGAFKRLILDQFFFSPIFIGFFLSTSVTLEGRPSEVVPKLQHEWFSAVLANWKLWFSVRFVQQQF